MKQAIDSVLASRASAGRRGRRISGLVASLLLHAGLLGAVFLIPFIASRNAPPIEFVTVRIVPVAALGVERPAPAREPEPSPPVPSIPKPEPAKPKSARKSDPDPAPPKAAEVRPSRPPAPRQRQGSPTGSSTGTASFGATAVAGLDNPDFVYGYYIDQMLAMIGSHWVRPAVGGGIESIIHFRVARGGQITELRVVKSSGHRVFDLAGLRAVERASPLPPLPQSYREGSLGVDLVIR